MIKFNKDTTISEILKHPSSKKILEKYNFPCLSCPWARYEIDNLKIGEVCKAYGINYDKLIKELNEKVSS